MKLREPITVVVVIWVIVGAILSYSAGEKSVECEVPEQVNMTQDVEPSA